VINCNLQRLDGPVFGNGQIMQELEGIFRGAGWNVIKVAWGSKWDELLAKDEDGVLVQRFNAPRRRRVAALRGLRRARAAREVLRLAGAEGLIEGWSDDDLAQLGRGGHDPVKVYAAYTAPCATRGRPR
jgi:pyruvate dehydrogenase E1 component